MPKTSHVAAALILFFLGAWMVHNSMNGGSGGSLNVGDLKLRYSGVRQCLPSDSVITISNLDEVFNQMRYCAHQRAGVFMEIVERFYDVSKARGNVQLPPDFRTKVKKWLGGEDKMLSEVYMQTMIFVYNKITTEAVVLNPLRSKRPGAGSSVTPTGDAYIKEVISSTEKDCDFCKFQSMTAYDIFGRVEHKYTMSASNTFKYDAAHGLVMFRHHNPLQWTTDEFADLGLALTEWFDRAHAASPELQYPHFMWDIMPKASASQIHPHVQTSMSQFRYYGFAEHLRLSAQSYREKYGDDYFAHLIAIHESLGLTVKRGTAVAMAYLTARKDWEIMIISPTANADFYMLLHQCLRAYIDDFKLYAISIAAYLPKYGPSTTSSTTTSSTTDSLPAIVRFVERGPIDAIRSDISAMELFGMANVNVDPFMVARRLQESIALQNLKIQSNTHEQQQKQQQQEEANIAQQVKENENENNPQHTTKKPLLTIRK